MTDLTAHASAGREVSTRAEFDQLLVELRPKLHRYCARITGSVIDGEDVVQEAIVKAVDAFPHARSILNPEGWLFRIAHNAALDFLRRRARQDWPRSGEDPDMIVDTANTIESRQAAATSLRTFMCLPVAQRSSVILMDVFGYSLEEIGSILEMSIPAVKASLHRGRTQLRELANEPDNRVPPVLAEPERLLLAAYVERFNARDFDAIRDMLAQGVRLEIVATTRLRGKKEVTAYFTNYSSRTDWEFAPGLVDGRPAVIARDPADLSRAPTYFVLVEWAGSKVASIRDFRHARYAIEGAEIVVAS